MGALSGTTDRQMTSWTASETKAVQVEKDAAKGPSEVSSTQKISTNVYVKKCGYLYQRERISSATCDEPIHCKQERGGEDAQGGDAVRTAGACGSGARERRLGTPSFGDDGVLEGRTEAGQVSSPLGVSSIALNSMSSRTAKADMTEAC